MAKSVFPLLLSAPNAADYGKQASLYEKLNALNNHP
jgi:hypothetical protein